MYFYKITYFILKPNKFYINSNLIIISLFYLYNNQKKNQNYIYITKVNIMHEIYMAFHYFQKDRD